jgi:cytoskeleton protein RodZ
MNAEADPETRSPAPVTPATPGELLRAERERRGFTIQQAAEDLHLDTWMLEAIEANRFLALGAPVYARGHLRKYATLLGLSPESILERYEALTDTPVVPTPIPTTVFTPARPRRSLKLPLWVGAAAIALAIVWAVLDSWLGREVNQDVSLPPAAESQLQASAEPAATSAALPQAAPAPAPVAQQVVDNSPRPTGSLPTESSVEEHAGAPAAEGGMVRLRLEFREPSWTEIYDSSGKRLMFDLGAPGRVRAVSGVPPLRVTLGFADAVTIAVDDRPLTIPRRAGKDAARFTIAADGSVSP